MLTHLKTSIFKDLTGGWVAGCVHPWSEICGWIYSSLLCIIAHCWLHCLSTEKLKILLRGVILYITIFNITTKLNIIIDTLPILILIWFTSSVNQIKRTFDICCQLLPQLIRADLRCVKSAVSRDFYRLGFWISSQRIFHIWKHGWQAVSLPLQTDSSQQQKPFNDFVTL